MDFTNMIPGGAGEEKTPQQQLSKEEYAAMKKQQREEVWAEVDAQVQAVFSSWQFPQQQSSSPRTKEQQPRW